MSIEYNFHSIRGYLPFQFLAFSKSKEVTPLLLDDFYAAPSLLQINVENTAFLFLSVCTLVLVFLYVNRAELAKQKL